MTQRLGRQEEKKMSNKVDYTKPLETSDKVDYTNSLEKKEMEEKETVVTPEKKEYLTKVTNCDLLNVRSKKSLKSDVLLQLKKGQDVIVLESFDEGDKKFVKVDLGDDAVGYVRTEYLHDIKE